VFGTSAIHVTAALPPPVSDIHINEIHYDNVNVDTGEAIEIEGPAGTDIAGYTLMLYNGSDGTVYNELPLTGTLPTSCGSRGVRAFDYPENGIQNGSPDAIALVDTLGRLVDYVSYEGVVVATAGPGFGHVPPTSSRRKATAHRWQLAATEFCRRVGVWRIELRCVQP
jgi:hypothetical protein